MNYYTSTIPLPLAEKLKEKGMMVDIDCDTFDEGTQYQRDEVWCNTTYAEVFDWLMEKGIHIRIESNWDAETQIVTKLACDFHIEKVGMRPIFVDCPTWHEAAEKAIEKALELIK